MRYRKKPVVVEAVQYFRDNQFLEPQRSHPGIYMDPNTGRDYVITIHEERAHLTDGDWILPEPKEGRFYPCEPDIFDATYEVAE